MVSCVSPVSPRSPNRKPAATGGHARRRRRGRRIALVGLGLAVLVAAAGFGWQHLQSQRVAITFTNGASPVPTLELTFFPDQLAFVAPSPPPPIGRVTVADATSVTVGRDLVPDRAVVRFAAPGVGTGFAHVQLGQPTNIELHPPRTLQGRVVEPIATWCFGWRCAGNRAVAGAEVVVMGGGEHGIELATVRSDADGRFTIEGLDLASDGLGLRVRAAGFAIAHQALGRSSQDLSPVVGIARTVPRKGRITGLTNVEPSSLRVLARGLPGVEAVPAADGTFVLDHVPADVQPRLLLFGLPGLLTHAPVRAGSAEAHFAIVPGATVRGRVVDGLSKSPLAGALVFFGDADAVRTDADGGFELAGLLPGKGEVQAQFEQRNARRRIVTRSGRRGIELLAGKVLEDVVVVVP